MEYKTITKHKNKTKINISNIIKKQQQHNKNELINSFSKYKYILTQYEYSDSESEYESDYEYSEYEFSRSCENIFALNI